MNYKFGWRPSLPAEPKPLTLNFRLPKGTYGPVASDLRTLPHYPAVYDQGQEGSCTGNAGAFMIDFPLKEQGYPWLFTPSRQFIYYNTRSLEGTTDTDAGATIANTFKSISEFGVCPENGNPDWSWPYVVDATQFKTKPPDPCYKDARLHVALTYENVPQDYATMQAVLAAGYPIQIGFTVHNSFMTDAVAKSGVMPKPGFLDGVAGGHSVAVVGYLPNKAMGDQGVTEWAICRNSWGAGWGDNGHFYMPWNEVLLNPNRASDFWCVHSVGFKGGSTALDTFIEKGKAAMPALKGADWIQVARIVCAIGKPLFDDLCPLISP
jgi:hypothetical protein